jgi:hypothetical protein
MKMSSPDERPDDRKPCSDNVVAANPGRTVYPGTAAWLRQLTLREIIAKPGLLVYQPRLFLEKPWLPTVLMGSVGFLVGIVGGAQQGAAEGIGRMAEGGLVCSFVAGVVGAIVMAPVTLVLWLMRETLARSAARTSTISTEDPRLRTPSIGLELRQFPYRPNRLLMVFMFLLGIGGEVLTCYIAFEEHDLLVSILAIILPVGLIVMGALVVSAFTQERRVAFTKDEVIVPRRNRLGMSCGETGIAFRDMVELRVMPMGLLLIHRQGKYYLDRTMFPTRNTYDAVAALLLESVARFQQKEAAAKDTEIVGGQEQDVANTA